MSDVTNTYCLEYIRDKSMQMCIHHSCITAFSKMMQQNVTHGHGSVMNIINSLAKLEHL